MSWTKNKLALSTLSLLFLGACASNEKFQNHTIDSSSPNPQNNEKICDFKPVIPIEARDAQFPLEVSPNGRPSAYFSWYDSVFLGLKKKHIEVYYELTDPCVFNYFKNGNWVIQLQQ